MTLSGQRFERWLKIALGGLWMAFILLMVLFPVYWTALASLKPTPELASPVPLFWTSNPTLDHYVQLWNEPFIYFDRLTMNSLIIALGSTVLAVALSVFAGMALARLRFPGRQSLGLAVFVAYLVPPSLLFIPLYVMLANFSLQDTRLGLILVYNSFSLPFCIWMLRSYFQTIPRELEESAMIDGCTRVGAWLRVVLPLAAPGIVAAAIFAFTLAWNEFLYAYILTETNQSQTMPIGLASFINLDVFRWGALSAGAVLMAIPAVVLYLLGQRFIVAGLTGGAVKG
jgi:multiple sugar transport system permease protein